ncbi:helix-turn-helix domain-containing protein [Nonomuraea jabiensis]|uniref:helix-turn-helix domain-containing protein n=1 Tax=Nonomuraea jabiensis TaxID=882448 RepID=UPI0036CB5194
MRLLARVARMYHEQGIRQPEIAAALNISRPRVSRLLKEGVARGPVRTVVTLPDGVHTEPEEELERQVADRAMRLVGGLGAAEVQVHATRLIARLAHPVFVPLTGVLATAAIR